MQRPFALVLGVACLAAGFMNNLVIADDGPDPKDRHSKPAAVKTGTPADDVDAKSKSKGDASFDARRTEQQSDERSASSQPSADELAIIATGEAFVKAFNDADEQGIAQLFVKDAEYINEQGTVVRGRESITEAFKASFESNSSAKIEMQIDQIRIVSPGVALEDGVTMVSRSEHRSPIFTRYSAVHVKSDGKWLVASVREQTPKEWRQHRTRMEELSWLQGDWVDEGDGAVVLFSCAPIDAGNFLLRKFSIHIAGHAAMTGDQRIGWDPLSHKFRSWIFDSEGGFSEGFWYRDENRWELKMTGVTADGQPASSTSIYTIVDENTITWQSVDHEVAGIQLPDSDPITIVRRGPQPDSSDQTVTLKSK